MKKIPFLLLIVAICTGIYIYHYKYQEVKIEDVGHSQVVTLVADGKMVFGLEAYVEGNLDDSAKIGNLMLGKGMVNTILHTGDYYVDSIRFIYVPYKAKEGNLTIRYRFNTN